MIAVHLRLARRAILADNPELALEFLHWALVDANAIRLKRVSAHIRTAIRHLNRLVTQ